MIPKVQSSQAKATMNEGPPAKGAQLGDRPGGGGACLAVQPAVVGVGVDLGVGEGVPDALDVAHEQLPQGEVEGEVAEGVRRVQGDVGGHETEVVVVLGRAGAAGGKPGTDGGGRQKQRC